MFSSVSSTYKKPRQIAVTISFIQFSKLPFNILITVKLVFKNKTYYYNRKPYFKFEKGNFAQRFLWFIFDLFEY